MPKPVTGSTKDYYVRRHEYRHKIWQQRENVYNFDDKKEHRVCAAHKQCGERKNRLEYLCCIFWRTKRSACAEQ